MDKQLEEEGPRRAISKWFSCHMKDISINMTTQLLSSDTTKRSGQKFAAMKQMVILQKVNWKSKWEKTQNNNKKKPQEHTKE